MRARLERIMERYGQSVTLTPGDGEEAVEIRAFVQPVLKEKEALPAAVTPLGPVSTQRWLYIGQAGATVRAGDRVSCNGMRLVVQEARPVYWRDEVFYRWAMLRREKEAAE